MVGKLNSHGKKLCRGGKNSAAAKTLPSRQKLCRVVQKLCRGSLRPVSGSVQWPIRAP